MCDLVVTTDIKGIYRKKSVNNCHQNKLVRQITDNYFIVRGLGTIENAVKELNKCAV